MDELKSEVKKEIKELANSVKDASFKFGLTGVSRFFETVGNNLYSERFWCRGMQWSLNVQWFQGSNQLKYLSLYLCCHNNETAGWFCKSNFKLTLFHSTVKYRNFVEKLDNIFKKESICGYADFIEYTKLTDEKNGYIKNDKIMLGVELKAGPVVRVKSANGG